MTRPAQPYHDRPPLLTLGYLCTPTVMSLSFLPLDVLLVIFRELGVVDVVRIGMVSPLAGLSSQNTFTDVQRPLPSHTGSSRLGRPTREVTSGRTGAQTCHAPNHFLLHARTQMLCHSLDEVTISLALGPVPELSWLCCQEPGGNPWCIPPRPLARREAHARHRQSWVSDPALDRAGRWSGPSPRRGENKIR